MSTFSGERQPVGQHSPLGDSPYGCADMAGNVWEWTRSKAKSYPYDAADGRENLSAWEGGLWVLRGGSFDWPLSSVRCACRYSTIRYGGSGNIGFRVVVVPVLSEL